MGIAETFIFYSCVGLVTAAALTLAHRESGVRAVGLFLPRALLWPFFAPELFGGALQRAAPPPTSESASDDELSDLEARLVAALQRLEGVAEEVLGPEVDRVRSLAAELQRMRLRIGQMEELRASPEFDAHHLHEAMRSLDDDDPRRESLESRRRSIERLCAMHDRACLEYEKVLLRLQELHSKILLLRFADDPEDEIVELMLDISSSVEGVCAGAFRD